MQVPYILSGDGNINLVFEGRQYQVRKDDPNYHTIWEVVQEKTQCTDEELLRLLSPEKQVKSHLTKQLSTNLKIEDGVVTYCGYAVHDTAVDRLVDFATKGIKTTPLENYLINVMENPSRSAAERLYGFLEHKNLPLTPGGCFLAYKAVTWDYKSKHHGPTGQLDNSIGTVVEVPRNRVDDNHEKDCSYGLHAGNLEYVEGFADFDKTNPDRIVIVEINPKDVVSVPDYNTDKLRCCRYRVVGDYCRPLTEPVHTNDQQPWNDDDDDEDEDLYEWDDDDDDEDEEEDDNPYDDELDQAPTTVNKPWFL